MIVLIVELELPRAERGRLLAALRAFDAETRREDGCMFFRHAVDVARDELIVLSEIWRDQAALVAHFRSAHFREYRKMSREAGLRPRIRQFEGREIDREAQEHVRALLAGLDREPPR